MLSRLARVAVECGRSGRPLRCRGLASKSGRLEVCALEGTPGSLASGLRALRELQPKQVMLETCDQRRLLAERRFASEPPIAEDSDLPNALSHLDAVDLVHGGVCSAHVVALLQAAQEIDAQVYMVDRPYQETQNRVARRLFLHPGELLAFIRHSAAVLASASNRHPMEPESAPSAPAGHESLKEHAPGIHEIVARERTQYMAAEVKRRRVSSVDALVFCTADSEASLRELLSEKASAARSAAIPSPVSPEASRIWPFLLVLAYLILPGYGSLLLAWRASRLLAAALASASSAVTGSTPQDLAPLGDGESPKTGSGPSAPEAVVESKD